MGSYRAVIFDVDGTLLNTTEGIVSSVRYTVDKLGLEMLETTELLSFIGPPIQESFNNRYHLTGKELQEATAVFRNRYKEYDLLKAEVYKGIYQVCSVLQEKGIKMAAATYKRQDYAEMILNHFGFDRYMQTVQGADHENKKMKADIIQTCIEEMDIKNFKDIIMIGDSLYDAIGAETLGIDFLGVTYGFGFKSREELKAVKAVGSAQNAADILHFIIEKQENMKT